MRPVLFVLAALAAPVAAQPVAPCAYAECALRIEPRIFGATEIVRGTVEAGDPVGPVGWFGGGLVDAVQGAPLAVAFAESSQAKTRNSFFAVLGATALYAYALSADPGLQGDATPVYLVGSLGLSVASGVFQVSARRDQARAVWEYNRTLAE